MKTILYILAIVLAVIAFIAVCYYLTMMGKHISYWLWYEDCVKDTVRQMVKPEYLIK